jgi:7-carboxy-7-deazaguanine synthase
MQVSEIFYSLQGEGPHIGEPSVFIRLGGCKEPYCPWCDTAYAWNEFVEMDLEEIVENVNGFSCRKIVITGGEPFLQWDSGLKNLHEELSEKGFQVSYETSGKAGIPEISNACIVLSPKHIGGTWQLLPDDLGKAHFYKFVAKGRSSFDEIHDFIQSNKLPSEKIYIMPMGQTRREQLNKMAEIFTFCRDNGYNMTPRLHILAFDASRGV